MQKKLQNINKLWCVWLDQSHTAENFKLKKVTKYQQSWKKCKRGWNRRWGGLCHSGKDRGLLMEVGTTQRRVTNAYHTVLSVPHSAINVASTTQPHNVESPTHTTLPATPYYQFHTVQSMYHLPHNDTTTQRRVTNAYHRGDTHHHRIRQILLFKPFPQVSWQFYNLGSGIGGSVGDPTSPYPATGEQMLPGRGI